MIGAVEFFK